MTIVELLTTLRSNGIQLWVEGEMLRYSAPSGALTPTLRAELVQHKADLLTLLCQAREDADGKPPPLRPVSQAGELPLSFAQQRLWFLSELQAEAGAIYSINAALRLDGELDQAALGTALRQLTGRQQSLRMNFRNVGGQPVIVLREPYDPLTVEDPRGLVGEEQETAIRRLADKHARQPFALADDPLLRLTLVELGADAAVLLFSIHHIIADGWSLGVLVRELSGLYAAACGGVEADLPPLPIQYPDYAAWQRQWLSGEVLERQVAYWREQLAGAPSLLELPTDYPRPAVKSYRGAQLVQSLKPELVSQLQQLSRSQGATLYMALLAAFSTLLSRYSGQEDVVVGSPIANRTQRQTEGLIGFFVNTLVLRSRVAPQQSFTELLAEVRQTALGAYAHQDLPFEKLVDEVQPERSLGHSPLFQVMFALQNTPDEALTLGGLQLQPLMQEQITAKFDLTVNLEEKGGGLVGVWEYSTDLFEAPTITRMAAHFAVLLRGIVADPEQALSRLPLLTETEQQQLAVWNHTATDYPRQQTVAGLFAEQAARTPEAVALVFAGGEMSYGELEARTNRLAHYLKARYEIAPDQVIGVCLERSAELIVGMLAILKAGAAYLPLDADYPPERLRFMLEDAGVSAIVTHSSFRARLPEGEAELICLDQDGPAIDQCPAQAPASAATAESLAYVMYTSGSTGQPKGVCIPQHAVVRLVCNTNYIHLGPGDRIGQAATPTFDAATFEIWGALLTGAAVYLLSRDEVLDPDRLAAHIRARHFTVLFLTTALFNRLAQQDAGMFRALDYLLFGGEAVDPRWVATVVAAGRPRRLLHVYGPTESTTFATWQEVEAVAAEAGTVPIGRPLANTQVYVLDEQQQLVGIGIPGELYIGGDGLAREYLKRPELTAERFVAVGGLGRLYRTGDRCRWREDGTIEFLGRLDRQIKLRGFRIEPGEVEVLLRREAGVQEAVVVVQGEGEHRQLIGYLLLAGGALDVEALRVSLRRQLPDYMAPSQLVVLEEWPLTANGKVDRSRLPAPPATLETVRHCPPITPTEELLVGLWCDVLKCESVNCEDNFFEVGGHSLLATQLISQIRSSFHLELPLDTIFASPTLRELAAQIDAHRHFEGFDTTIPLADREHPLPLSFAQERLWFLNQLEPDNPFYNTPLALRLRGRLEKASLQAALQQLVVRHEVLRTAFHNKDGQPQQVVLQELPLPLAEYDFRELPATEREAALLAEIRREARTPFRDLDVPPLVRASLLKLEANEHALLLTFHHIITDGWSLGVLARDLAHLYNANSTGRLAELPPLPIQYADFAAWQRQWLRGEVLERQLDYWRHQLGGAPPTLALPADYSRPAVQSFRGGSLSFSLDRATRDALQRLSRTHDATLFMTLLAGFAVLLYRYSGQADIVIGSPIAGRQRAEVENLLGFFVNTLALRIDLTGRPSFSALLERVRQCALEAYAHQDLPFEKLVDELQPERDLSRNPLFQVMFALQNMPFEEVEMSELRLSPIHTERSAALFDLVVDFWDVPDGLHGVLEYNSDLFERSSAERLVRHLQTVLRSIATDLEANIDALPLLDTTEHSQILTFSNGPAAEHPVHQSLVQVFESQVTAAPQRIAAVADGITLDYETLNRCANRTAHLLRGLGLAANTPAGVLLPRGLDYLTAVLGVIKAGGAFLPLETAYPVERLCYMVEDSGIRMLLTNATGLAQLASDGALPAGLTDVVLISAAGIEQASWPTGLRLHTEAALARQPTDNPPVANSTSDLLYMLYTSGSTGLPKGTLVRHDGALNHIFAEFRLLEFSQDTVFLQSAPASSDISVWQCLAPLLIGGCVVFADFETMCSPTALFELIRDQRVTLIELVPIVLEGLVSHVAGLAEAERELPHLQWAMVTGESVSAVLVNRWFQIWPQIPLVNAYGPTEAADDVCQHVMRVPLPETQTTVPIGKPVDNLSVLVLDSRQQFVPIGVPGEICVSGIGVGAGYWRQPERTDAAFIPNPHREVTFGETLYRTGDVGRWRADGSLEFLGRLDHQVKIRGFRVELGEIEAALRQHRQIREALVLDHQDQQGERQLAAYVQVQMDTARSDELIQQQVTLWKDLHEDSYRDTRVLAVDPTFNSIGWDSTYTGEPLSRAEMQECVENAVTRILALQPQRMLEIGCGTGLLLYRLVPHCVQYYGTDLSAVAISQLRASQKRLNIPGLDRATLSEQRADDFTGFDAGAFDTIVLNSVVQYFPSVDYLLEVMRKAVRHCVDGGAIFLGDVRSLALLRSYHASVQGYKAEDTLTCDELAQRIEGQIARDQELAIAPEFFQALRRQLPRISATVIRPKRGWRHNEMTRFRYDVVLRIGPSDNVAPCATEVCQDWRLTCQDLATIRTHLETTRPQYWGLRHVANARLQAEQRMRQWLTEATPSATVRELRQWLAQPTGPALDPEALWRAAETLPYNVEILLEPDSTNGAFAVFFTRRDRPPVQIDLAGSSNDVTPRPWSDYANNPLQEKCGRLLAPQLRDFLKAHLPGHMIPAAFMVLDRFPLTPNGKIDRGVLPKPNFAAAPGDDHVTPRTATERAIQAVWGEVLGVDEPSVNDNFFALGGHSLKATQVVSRLQQQKKTLSLRDIFNYPTIAELAALLDLQPDGTALEAIPVTPRAAHYPVSHAQQRLWVLAHMDSAAAYHMVDGLRLRGPLKTSALSHAFTILLGRHETLRTAFIEVDGELRQQVADAVQPALDFVDLSGHPAPLSAAHELALEHARSGFDLSRAPLLRVSLVKLDAEDHVLLFNMHHIVSDGWSLDVLIREFMLLYAAAVAGRSDPLPPLRIQHRDYVVWQQELLRLHAEAQREYWLRQLHDFPPPLELATDFPRPPRKTYNGGRCRACVPLALLQTLNALAQTRQVSLFILLTALVKVLLHRYSGETDINVGCPVAGRNHPDLENQIGFFTNTLVLRDRVDGAQPFTAFLQQVRDTITTALSNQDYPFDQLVQDLNPPRDPSRNPLFDVMLVLQNTANVDLRLPEVQITSLGLDHGVTQFDMLWNFAEGADGLHVDLQYNSDLFRAETVEQLLAHWQTLVNSVVAEPETPVGRLPLLTLAERAALLEVSPPPVELQPAYRSLVHWFEAQAAATPQATAVSDEGRQFSYAELNTRANHVARHVRKHLDEMGKDSNGLVGLCMHRSAELVIGLLGILKAGAAYVPLDPDVPAARLQFILRDARLSLLVTQSGVLDQAVEELPRQYWLDAEMDIAVADAQNLDLSLTSSAPAYVIYTSGSTGEPKGAVITHGNVLRLFSATHQWFDFGAHDVWTLFHSYAFDFSVWEMWGALLYGGRLVIVPYLVSRAPEQFYELLGRERVTVLNQTPSAFRQLLQAEAARQESLPLALRYVIFGGEALDPMQLQPWFDRHGDQRPQLVNMYGITETTVHVTYRPLSASDARQSASLIGAPIPDLYLYVLDEWLAPAPPGVAGELYVGGAGLAQGYLHRDELTAQRFIADPFRPAQRLYRTGDRVRRRVDGGLEYLGRFDDQIKIRGFRIELGEITAILGRHPEVREAIVTVRRQDGDASLVAYYVPMDGALDDSELRRHLQQHLPAYMAPARFMALPRLPLTANGKLDYRALPKIEQAVTGVSVVKGRAPRSALEAQMLDLWKVLLGNAAISVEDNVFEHGAHSVLAIQFRNHLQALRRREIPAVLLFQYPTVAALAAQLESGSLPAADNQEGHQRGSQRREAARRRARQQRPDSHREP